MSFCEFRFVPYFLVVFLTYWGLRSNTARKSWLLACSYFFYGCWDWRFLSLIAVSTLVDYLVGWGLGVCHEPRARKTLLGVSLAVNLGLLGFFKYFGFFVESASELLARWGLPFDTGSLQIILPVGISFYTFQTLSYSIDVYRRRLQPTRNVLDFALFVSFFPQLVAGPVVRATSFLPQLELLRRWSWTRMQFGLQLFVLGLFKKVAIADRMAEYCQPVFADISQYDTGALWYAAVAFAVQVYCDFSGYSDMAIGCASFLGYRLTKNFDRPFLAVNVADFWRRWHMSLSSWVRDYLYFPLGGSRRGEWITARNLLVTMTLLGLWHGAAWTFVAFGVIQGVYLVVHRQFQRLCRARPLLQRWCDSPGGTALRIALTFVTFCGSLAVFRAPSVADGFQMLQRMVVPVAGMGLPTNERGFWYALLVIGVGYAIGGRRRSAARLWQVIPAPLRGLGYACFCTAALVLSPVLDQAFVYFQF